ncbi:MAG: cysteine--tRNA ligase [Bacteroidales bacterium]|jgi:cysteinyl-tRNA synthetase|nr:cysteine--tRNA ligase [Bacteroidales bacterium]
MLNIYNTVSRSIEQFTPANPPLVGLYVCGPTVYGEPHLGHARSAVTFDLVFRYLKYLGYKVRYIRNVTDVGHLENDADEGEDKIAKKARLEQLEPMEVAQYYTNRYHQFMSMLNVLPPSIEPLASGHIIEQIELIKQILKDGYAYEINGSVYFDLDKYAHTKEYGKLSGRIIDDLFAGTRDNLDSQDEKRNPLDFALWKKAQPEHIMRWISPWGEGFPGWHTECTAMSHKYLGENFDIHGGGMDLIFPHHEAEIAQSNAAYGHNPCRYWMHNNMITINGKKMGKSLGNAISLEQFFTGKHPLLQKAYNPQTIRFFLLQAHYRSTLDFTNDALQAAEKGLERLQQAGKTLQTLTAQDISTVTERLQGIESGCIDAMNDDFNSPIALSHLFELVRLINAAADGKEKFTPENIAAAKKMYKFLEDVLGISDTENNNNDNLLEEVMQILLELRKQAKDKKDFALSDLIRNELAAKGIQIMDGKDGAKWTIKK